MSLHKPKIIPFSHVFLIQAVAGPEDPHAYFLNTVQHIVDKILPESLWLERKSLSRPQELFDRLESMLPIFHHSEVEDTSDSMVFSYLCPAQYSPRARRFVFDMLSKWLNPKNPIEIAGGINLNFQFVIDPSRTFCIVQKIIAIRDRIERQAIRNNLPNLIAELQRTLTPDFLKQSENFIHPIFMPRNEEEMIRNLIVLATQINYVRDLPQVSIHYDKQTDFELTFTVLVVRLLKGDILPLRKLLERSFQKMDIDDVRVMGYLKQKYLKEGAVFRVTLEKRPFFRPDYSVDLLRARQKIVSELNLCLGPFRDFNGGMILKQDEALVQLRQELSPLSLDQEFLLENYFYSLKPGIMQTVHDTFLLKKHFELLKLALSACLKWQSHFVTDESREKFFLSFIVTPSSNVREIISKALAPLEISSRNLTTSSLKVGDLFALGFIFHAEKQEEMESFHHALLAAIQE